MCADASVRQRTKRRGERVSEQVLHSSRAMSVEEWQVQYRHSTPIDGTSGSQLSMLSLSAAEPSARRVRV
jgi:hypothetical protein